MLKIQLRAIIPINTAHPMVRIMAAPIFFITLLKFIFLKSNLNHKKKDPAQLEMMLDRFTESQTGNSF